MSSTAAGDVPMPFGAPDRIRTALKELDGWLLDHGGATYLGWRGVATVLGWWIRDLVRGRR